jgi:hypothetical protein
MARIFGGLLRVSTEIRIQSNASDETAYLATPPTTLQGSLTIKKLHRLTFRQCSAKFSRSNSSPNGHPHPASRISCMAGLLAGGQTSTVGWSPETAEKFCQIQRSISSVCSSPQNECVAALCKARSSSSDFDACAAIQPVRMTRMSPKRTSVPCAAKHALMSDRHIGLVLNGSKLEYFGSFCCDLQLWKSTRMPRPTMPFLAHSALVSPC